MTQSVSVIVPALNEELGLRPTVETVISISQKYFKSYEVLIFNDGSTDRTGSVADLIAKSNPNVKVIHHITPRNLGACYKEGLMLAKNEYVLMVPGDNECGEDVLNNVFSKAGAADIIVPYTVNNDVRPFGRQILSILFTQILNKISGQNLRYYNGTVLHKTALIKSISIETNSFGYQAEALVKMLRKGYTFLEIPVHITYRPSGSSKALKIKNILQTLRFLTTLVTTQR